MDEDPATPSGTAGTPFSEATDTFVGGSAPDLTNHPHLDNSMRSLSSSVAARRKEYAEKNFKLMANRGHIAQGSIPRDDAATLMKRTRSEPWLADHDSSLPKIHIGICAMDKKAHSRPMNAIVERLEAYGEFDIKYFGDETILHKPITEWPTCDCLLSWHSDGFPLAKAQKYAALRKPYLINDMIMQDVLLDRRRVYTSLKESGIPVPHHICVNRDNLPPDTDPPGFIETEDYVEQDGVQIKKPFVEKPVSGEDHNIYIYYPHAMGGGVKRLYRKIENRSGDYDPTHPGTVRRDGSYIIEEFLTTGGTDVKVYTVGPRYAHAEARKSPVVDGKVTRSADGKELRFPVLLSPQEKEIARMVCLAFGQKVCGFDLLRSERGKSYVCDVNGWSFVKNSHKYYDDAAGILRSIILSAIAPHRLATAPPQLPLTSASLAKDEAMMLAERQATEEPNFLPYAAMDSIDEVDDRHYEELRCVLAIVRHGDRTPKQKMKMKITQEPLLELLRKHMDPKGKQAKLKSPAELQELLDVTRALLAEMDKNRSKNGGSDGKSVEPGELKLDADQDELREKFGIVRTVLEHGGSFAGVNRKVQLKPLRWAPPEEGSQDPPRIVEALLILKHGGVLTHAGRQQAEALGNVFRTVMYPRYGPAGGGLLRLHSTYRHDLKIYSSDEGRVQTSAAAFTQGLLDLEGDSLTPILVSLVKKDAGMLDAFGKGASEDIRAAKAELYAQMTWDPLTAQSLNTPPQITTPMPSPPPSPKVESDPTEANAGGAPSPQGVSFIKAADFSQSRPMSPMPSGLGSRRASHDGSVSSGGGGGSRRGTDEAAPRPVIHPMPAKPLSLLRQLTGHIKVLVEKLRQMCLEERVGRNGPEGRSYSALTQSSREWGLEPGKPCGGERLLLMFDRWRKLLKAFYSEKKQQFDISKVPDIYDSAKYDAIHNSELGLDLKPLYTVAKQLADCVIPNEYGIDPPGKMRIGSKICCALLGKLLADLANMREESIATAGMEGASEPVSPFDSYVDLNPSASATAIPGPAAMHDAQQQRADAFSATSAPARLDGADTIRSDDSLLNAAVSPSSTGVLGTEETAVDDDEVEEDRETLHRLCPAYAQDINSPLRHVRTRIYFTSESHMHSLINVLRFAHISRTEPTESLVSDAAQELLRNTTELDYMTHIVFRMYENKRVPVESAERFRVELLFSPGAGHNPFEVIPIKQDHTLPIALRTPLHRGTGTTWSQLSELLSPHSTPQKASTYTYSMQ
ncbi:g4640 [Coccomyxa elongata]